MSISAGNNEDDELYMAIGHFVIGWSFVETSITHWLQFTLTAFGKPSGTPAPGDEFKRKATYLRQQFCENISLKPYSEAAISLLNEAGSLTNTRRFVIHGASLDIDSEKREIHFVLIESDKGLSGYRDQSQRITFDRLIADGRRCHDLANRMMALTKRLLEEGVFKDSG